MDDENRKKKQTRGCMSKNTNIFRYVSYITFALSFRWWWSLFLFVLCQGGGRRLLLAKTYVPSLPCSSLLVLHTPARKFWGTCHEYAPLVVVKQGRIRERKS